MHGQRLRAGGLLLFLRRMWGRSPDARGLRPMRTPPPKWSGQHLILRCPSPFGVSVSSGDRSANTATRIQGAASPASAYLRVHLET